MIRFVGTCVILFLIAAGFILVNQSDDVAALVEAFRTETLSQKFAWLVAVATVSALIPSALWLCDSLMQQRKMNEALESRFGGVRLGVRELAKLQIDADAVVHHLARTDPEAAIDAVTQRLIEAERTAEIQGTRNDVGDLQAKVDELHTRQQSLRERLVPMLEKRRAIERLFADFDSRANDIDRVLTEIVAGDDAVAIEVRLNKLMEFVRHSHERCDAIDRAVATMGELKEDFAVLRERLAPHAALDGVKRQVKDLADTQKALAADMTNLQQTPQGDLDARMQAFADEKKKLGDGVDKLELHVSTLIALRKAAEGLSEKFEHVLDPVSPSEIGDADSRIADFSRFIAATQSKFDKIERSVAALSELQSKLDELQSRLTPLESEDGGVVDLVGKVCDLRDRVIARIEGIEAAENGDLAARVKVFNEMKQELEARVSAAAAHSSKLVTIRDEIAGLSDKLSNAADTPSN